MIRQDAMQRCPNSLVVNYKRASLLFFTHLVSSPAANVYETSPRDKKNYGITLNLNATVSSFQ